MAACILVGPIQLQLKTPAGRNDIYADSILDKLTAIVKAAQQTGSGIIFSSRFVDPRLDKSLFAPLFKLFAGLPYRPVIMVREQELVDGHLPVSHTLNILGAAGVIDVLLPGESRSLEQVFGGPVNQMICHTVAPADIALSDVWLYTEKRFPASDDLGQLLVTPFSLDYSELIAEPHVKGLTVVGRKQAVFANQAAQYLQFREGDWTVVPVPGSEAVAPFDQTEREMADAAGLEGVASNRFSVMLGEARERIEASEADIEAALLDVIREMSSQSEVDNDAIEIVMALMQDTSPTVGTLDSIDINSI